MNEQERIERCARAAHNVLVAYSRLSGDYAMKEWDEAEEWQRQSSIELVHRVINGECNPRKEHESWLQGKLAKGYVYGESKNDNKDVGPLTNPCIMDYDKLPLYLRMKTALQVSAILGMAGHYDLVVKGAVPSF